MSYRMSKFVHFLASVKPYHGDLLCATQFIQQRHGFEILVTQYPRCLSGHYDPCCSSSANRLSTRGRWRLSMTINSSWHESRVIIVDYIHQPNNCSSLPNCTVCVAMRVRRLLNEFEAKLAAFQASARDLFGALHGLLPVVLHRRFHLGKRLTFT